MDFPLCTETFENHPAEIAMDEVGKVNVENFRYAGDNRDND